MNNSHGLSELTVQRIRSVLAQYPVVERAVLFGSRAKGNYKTGSDIDLALSGSLDWITLGSIHTALEDSAFPYSFSLVRDTPTMDADLQAQIQRVGKLFYERPADLQMAGRRETAPGG